MMPAQNDDWWASAFRFAVLQAGLAPGEFWRLSLAELAVLAGTPGAPDLPSRKALEDLMQAHPDLPTANPKRQDTL